MPEAKVTETLLYAAETLSLSSPLREDGDAELGDLVPDRGAATPFESAAVVAAARRDRPPPGAARRP